MLVVQAYRFALDPTPAQERKLASHARAARFAYNFGLALVKELVARRRAGEELEVPWSLAALRREWNARKAVVAPWWAENSKEAASSGLADLAAGFKAFLTPSTGGAPVRGSAFRGSSVADAAVTASGTPRDASASRAAAACSCHGSGTCARTSRPSSSLASSSVATRGSCR
jgi:Helix-turn-helix domain